MIVKAAYCNNFFALNSIVEFLSIRDWEPLLMQIPNLKLVLNGELATEQLFWVELFLVNY